VIFSLLEMIHTEVDEVGPTQSTTKQDCWDCMVALPSNLFYVWGVQESFGRFCSEPISESDAHLFCSFDSTNTSRQLWAEGSSFGCFVCEKANSRQVEVNRGRGQMAAFEFQSISQNNGLAESEPGLGTVPFDEIVDRESEELSVFSTAVFA
jgi:hypothetical protein